MLFGDYQDWVHQNPVNHIYMEESQRMLSVKIGIKQLSVFLPNATMHRMEKLGENLSQPSQWSLVAYEPGSVTPSG